MTTEHDKQLIFDVTTENFQQKVLDASKQFPIVVDFWADWCGPCKMLAPILEKAVSELAGQVYLAKVNTEEESTLAQKYQIRGIPAVKAFYKGQVVDEFVGLPRNPSEVSKFLQRLVSSKD